MLEQRIEIPKLYFDKHKGKVKSLNLVVILSHSQLNWAKSAIFEMILRWKDKCLGVERKARKAGEDVQSGVAL